MLSIRILWATPCQLFLPSSVIPPLLVRPMRKDSSGSRDGEDVVVERRTVTASRKHHHHRDSAASIQLFSRSRREQMRRHVAAAAHSAAQESEEEEGMERVADSRHAVIIKPQVDSCCHAQSSFINEWDGY